MDFLLKQPWWPRVAAQNRRVARALMLLAVLWFGWRLAGTLWLVTGQDGSSLSPLGPSGEVASALPEVDTGQLAGFAIFKTVVQPASGSDATHAPDTSLHLRLDGVFAGADRQRSGAIIADPNQGVGQLYRPGQSVPGGATLDAVYADRVILLRNGTSEVLRFAKTNLLGGDAPPAATAPAVNQAERARAMLDSAINRLGSAPDAYLAEMGLIAGGEGYEITEGAPANLRRGLGLKPGDRILRLNGQPLGNPQMDRQLLEQVKQSGHVRVEFRRGSQNLTIEQNF